MDDKFDPILQTDQKNINRQFKKRIDELETSSTPYDDTEIKADISALETAVGDDKSGLVKDVADINEAIGDESDATSILGRIKALEDAS